MSWKICAVCGNEIRQSSSLCRFCGSAQPSGGARTPRRRGGVSTVNIKTGLPPVEEGITRLENELLRLRHSGVRLVRVIHGWGSGGSEGKLKKACRAHLQKKKGLGQVKSFLPGEDYSRDNAAGRNLVNRYPELQESLRTDRRNSGITFVEL